jgi:hypothetical protein
MPKAVSILFGALLTVSTAHALGRLLLARLQVKLAREEQLPYGFLVGAPLLSLVVFALLSLRLVYDPAFLLVALGAHLAAWRWGAFQRSQDQLPALPRLWRWLFWTVYTVFGVVALICAMAPEWSADGSSYHLGVMQHYYRAHGFVRLETQGVELLFLMAWAFGRHSAGALTHCAFLLALPLMMLRFGQRSGHALAGAAAALFVMCSPLILVDGTSAYIDVAVAAALFAVFALCEMEAPAVLIGLMAGSCFGMKYTAFLAIPYAGARLLMRRKWRDVAVFGAAAALMMLPWVVRNVLWFQNPASPFLNAWFPNQWIHVSFEQDYAGLMRHYVGLESDAAIPLEVTIHGQVLGGFLGPLFLLAPVALLSLRFPLGRRLLAAALVFALPFAANVGTRFLLPALPFVSFAMALALPVALARWILPLLVLSHALASFPDVPSVYCKEYGWRVPKIPLRQALRIETEDSWLSRKWPPYRLAKMLERATPERARIFAFSPVAESYMTREVAVGYQSALGERLRDHIQVPLIQDFQPVLSHSFTFPAQEVQAIRVVQTAEAAKGADVRDYWSITEFRIFDGKEDLERSQEWRIDARPYPWDVGFAFDGSPLTRWRSWQWMKPGWYVEAKLGRPRRVDRIVLEMSSDQYAIRMRAEALTPAGAWVKLSEKPVVRGLAPPLGLRRMATDEVKRAGFAYILVSEDDFKWQDFRDKADMWGLREAGSVDNFRLYRIE